MDTTRLLKIGGIALLVIPLGYVFIFYLIHGYNPIFCLAKSGQSVTDDSGVKYCLIEYEDGGEDCYANEDCLSKKCVTGTNFVLSPEAYAKTLRGEKILGECSPDSRPQTVSGESIVGDAQAPERSTP